MATSVMVPPLLVLVMTGALAWHLHRLTAVIGPEDRPELVAMAASAGHAFFGILGAGLVAATISWMSLRVLRSALNHAREDLDAQSERQERERLARAFEDLHHHAIFMIDSEGRVASWDRDAERLLGYRGDDVIARHVSCLYDASMKQQDLPSHDLVEAATRGRTEGTRWIRRKDGFRFEASVSVVAIRDGEGSLRGFTQVIHELLEEQAA